MSPSELVMVADTGGTPVATITGKLNNDPDPTAALSAPAPKPAATTATISHPVMRASPSSLTRGPRSVRRRVAPGVPGTGVGQRLNAGPVATTSPGRLAQAAPGS